MVLLMVNDDDDDYDDNGAVTSIEDHSGCEQKDIYALSLLNLYLFD